ncbi:MAG: hypothetical protein MJE68_14100, partial [Proteobacteria bacterium]|nr:hypothetical protein [Pseudomonadota bacterium]
MPDLYCHRPRIIAALSNYSPLATPLNGVHVLASGATVREKAIKGLVTKADGEKQLGIELRTNL